MCRDCTQTDTRTTACSTVTIPLIRRRGSAGLWVLGVITASMMAAPSALADPVDPTPPPPPVSDTATQAVSGDPAVTPTGVPHLMSPQNLPPGTTTDAAVGSQGTRLFRLRELWDAMHTQGFSLSDALPLLAQRPLDANAVPPPGVSAGPQPPLPAEPLPPTP
jgi:hypothetical protein